ncbi:MAG: MFS transporter [Chloroflexota bacterium]|nr:MFS transporter [Chloroflexota bacterium]
MDPSIWHNRHFMLLWAAQVIGQTAQNAVHYGLLVLVQTRTHSAAHMSFAVLTVVLPSVIFGLVAGAYVDRRDKRLVLIGANLARAALMPLYVVFPEWLLVIYGLNFLFSTISQFFAPAELAMLPTVVKRGHLLQANSLFQVTFTASQLIGFVILGPLVINLWGIGGMLAAAALCTWPLPSTHRRLEQQIGGFRDLWHEIFYVLRYVRSDAIISLAVIQWTVGSTLMLIVATLAPNFVVHILQVRVEDSVFVLAPAGVGTVLGSLVLGRYGARVDRLRLVWSALVAVGLLVCLMALAGPVWQSLGWVSYAEGAEPTFWGHWSLIGVVMALAFVAGSGFVSILVPTQTVIQERAEEGVRGRLFAVQLVLANVASILPLVVLSELADHLGVPWTLLLVGLGVLGSGVWSAWHAASLRTAAEQGHHSSAA